MTELDEIAKQLGNLVSYERGFYIFVDGDETETETGYEYERLCYHDYYCWIVASTDLLGGTQELNYSVNAADLKLCIAALKRLDNDLVRKIIEELSKMPCDEEAKHEKKLFLERRFIVQDYGFLPELIRLHRNLPNLMRHE